MKKLYTLIIALLVFISTDAQITTVDFTLEEGYVQI